MSYNTNWAKYVNANSIDYAPIQITKGTTTYIPYPVDMMKEDGYKPVTNTPYPTDGKKYIGTWKNNAKSIVRVWTEDTTPEEPTEIETIEAQVLYTAMMTDTLLEDEEEE